MHLASFGPLTYWCDLAWELTVPSFIALVSLLLKSKSWYYFAIFFYRRRLSIWDWMHPFFVWAATKVGREWANFFGFMHCSVLEHWDIYIYIYICIYRYIYIHHRHIHISILTEITGNSDSLYSICSQYSIDWHWFYFESATSISNSLWMVSKFVKYNFKYNMLFNSKRYLEKVAVIKKCNFTSLSCI